MVIFASNGDLIVQRRNTDACQWLEYTALQVLQYCKETAGRNKRLYDLRGVMVCNMAGDLKDFVKGYLEVKDNKRNNYRDHISSSMIVAIRDALDAFGRVYESGSARKCVERLEEEFRTLFKYEKVVRVLLEKLSSEGMFVVSRCDSASTSSVYFDLDYGTLTKVRVSDHYVDYDGIQLLIVSSIPEEAGKNGVYFVKEDYDQAGIEKVVGFIYQRLVNEKTSAVASMYKEYLKGIRDKYKDENQNYKMVQGI